MYLYDMHVHTREVSPCAHISAKDVVLLYRQAGYSGLVITDHYAKLYFSSVPGSWKDKIDWYLTGYHTALDEAAGSGFQIFLGMEIRFPENPNDYLVYGLTPQFLYENPACYQLDLSAFQTLVKKNGFLLYQAHPYRPTMQATPEFVDGFEVYNGNRRHHSYNEEAKSTAAKYGLLQISGSDFHEKEDLARGGIRTNKRLSTQQELISTLKSRKYHCIETL